MPRKQTMPSPKPSSGSVRIIGGHWRGRRVQVLEGSEVRPTPDRVRETLFNWLAPRLPGARCLDLYAGTGILGLEALSRGAALAFFIEREARLAAAIGATLARFGEPSTGASTAQSRVVVTDVLRWLRKPPLVPFDGVFLDPPYATNKLADLCTLLACGWLTPGAWVYLETGRSQPLPGLPQAWQWHRESKAGEVRYALAVVRSTQL